MNCLAPNAVTRLTENLMGGDALPDDVREALAPRWIASVATWLASPEAAGVTGRVFDVQGKEVGIAESWIKGPVAEQSGDPTTLKPIIADLMSKAQLNADMRGDAIEGPGRPAKTI